MPEMAMNVLDACWWLLRLIAVFAAYYNIRSYDTVAEMPPASLLLSIFLTVFGVTGG